METCPYRKASFSLFVAGLVVSVCHVIDGLSHINLSRALGMGFSRCVYMYLCIYSYVFIFHGCFVYGWNSQSALIHLNIYSPL